jgi:hypothetical protein
MSTVEGRGGGRRGVIVTQTGLQVRPGGHKVATQERDGAHGRQALPHEARIALAVRQVVDLLGQLAGGVQLCLGNMKPIKTLEYLEPLWCIPHLMT